VRLKRFSFDDSTLETTLPDGYSDVAIDRSIWRPAGFFAGIAQAQQADAGDEQQAGFDEKFAAIEPIHGSVFQTGIGEQAVPEKSGGSEINGEVERFPKMAAETEAHVGSDDDEGEQIESDSADGIVERLLGRMHGVDDVQDTEARIFVEKQNRGMKG